MNEPISITAISSISPLGNLANEIWKNYQNNDHFITEKYFENFKTVVAEIPSEIKQEILMLCNSDSKYKSLDDSVLFAIYVSRKAALQANWKASDNFGINIGSSRGATSLFEKYHEEFLSKKQSSTLSSPTTTLGNISSWVAHDLQTQGPEISHSITCSTALHALLNGIAWIQSGMTDKFLVGGSEAALTEFTIAQMKALKIYAKCHSEQSEESYPCRALDLSKNRNSMVLGEAASIACLESGIKKNSLAIIEGVGFATEVLENNTSLSTEAICFQRSMKMALGNIDSKNVDIIVMHAPGTIKGDLSEHKAIQKVFGDNIPFMTTNKWKLGHTFAASGMLNIELAILMLQHQKAIKVPFAEKQQRPKQIKKVLVNAVGFGGNAVSVLLTKK